MTVQLKPEWQQLGQNVTGFFRSIGWVWSIVLVIGVLIIGWYVFGLASDGLKKYQTDREVERLTTERDQHKADAEGFKTERNQALGAAAAYKEQAESLEQERSILLNERPELQSRVQEAGRKVDEIRNQPLKPVSGDMVERVNDVGSKLDRLYPDH